MLCVSVCKYTIICLYLHRVSNCMYVNVKGHFVCVLMFVSLNMPGSVSISVYMCDFDESPRIQQPAAVELR